MAVQTAKSTVISNRDATPKVLSDGFLSGGKLTSSIGGVQTPSAADSSGSKYTLVQVPSNARVKKIELQNDALGGSCACKVGVYWPTFIPVGAGLSASNQGAAISDNLFASALSLVAAATPTDITNQSGNNTIAKQEQPLWQAAGLASDPGIDLDITVALTAAAAAQGYIGVKVDYQF